MDDANIMLPNIHIISRLIIKFNALRVLIQGFSIERDEVRFITRKQESMASSTNIITPLYHFSTQRTTTRHWCNESAWRCFILDDIGNFQFIYSFNVLSPSDAIKTI